jgi:hypothetical protein
MCHSGTLNRICLTCCWILASVSPKPSPHLHLVAKLSTSRNLRAITSRSSRKPWIVTSSTRSWSSVCWCSRVIHCINCQVSALVRKRATYFNSCILQFLHCTWGSFFSHSSPQTTHWTTSFGRKGQTSRSPGVSNEAVVSPRSNSLYAASQGA